jgi:hypothetical protein
MAKIIENDSERSFALTVNTKELQLIQRALLKDETNDNENGSLYYDVQEFTADNDVDSLDD